MTEALTELGNRIALKRSDCVLSWSTSHGELSIEVVPAHLLSLVEYLKLDAGCKFTTLVDITAVDYPERTKRFDVVYHFLSMYQINGLDCMWPGANMRCCRPLCRYTPVQTGLSAKYLICLACCFRAIPICGVC